MFDFIHVTVRLHDHIKSDIKQENT